MSAQTHPEVIVTGTFDQDDERTWRHVPFDVPVGIEQIHLTISYNDMIDSNPFLFGGSGNTLDIGLFDERGIASGGPGFRGWSGSNKLEFTIGSD